MTVEQARKHFNLSPDDPVIEDNVLQLWRCAESLLDNKYLSVTDREQVNKDIEAYKTLLGY